mgnify:FL=1
MQTLLGIDESPDGRLRTGCADDRQSQWLQQRPGNPHLTAGHVEAGQDGAAGCWDGPIGRRHRIETELTRGSRDAKGEEIFFSRYDFRDDRREPAQKF